MAYSGMTASIPLGEFGLLTDQPPSQVPRGAMIKANDVSFETGLVTKARGSARYNTQVLPAGIVALHDWWPDVVSQRLIALCSNGSIYRDIGDRVFSSASAIASGLLNVTAKSMFVEGGVETALRSKKLFLFTGTNQLKVLEGDGSSFADVDLPAADWSSPNYPTFGFTHRNRLWAFMKNRAYASETSDHENFTGGTILTMSVYPGEGGDLIGGTVFKGRAFVFKQGGFVYFLDDTDVDSDNWAWRKVANNFGLASPHALIEIGNDMVGVNEAGSPTSYSAVEQLGEIESADLLRLLQIEEHFRNNSSLSGLEVLHAIYYEAKKQAFFTWRNSYRTTNNMLLHIDYNKGTPRPAIWLKDQADCLALRKDNNKVQRPIYGSSDGYVYLMDQEDRLVGSSAFTGEFKTGHMDFRWLDDRLGQKNKLFDFLEVEFIPQGTWNLEVDVYIDGNFMETINFSMDVRDDGLDSFTLDTDALGREESQTIRKPLHGSGRRISFHCKQSGSNQNFAIASLTVGFRASDEKAAKV
jgi:hypothetical protein